MNNNEKLIEDIKLAYTGNSKVKKAMKKVAFYKVTLAILSVFGIILFLLISSGVFVMDSFIASTLNPIIMIAIFIGVGLLTLSLLIFGVLFYFKRDSIVLKKEKKFFEALNENETLGNIYLKYFQENLTNKKVEELKFNPLNPTSVPLRSRGGYRAFISNLPVTKNVNENRLEFTINGKKAMFLMNRPHKFTEGNYWNSRNRSERVYTVSSNVMFLQSNDFDQSFNGIRVRKGKAGKDSYQSESVEFNNKFKINLSSTDFRAAKFLSPKVIEGMTKEESKDFFSIGVDSEVYNDRMLVGKPIYPVGVINIRRNLSWEGLAKLIAKKIEQDLKVFERSLKIIELFA
ncbi:hypothetical protein SCHIN_v1c09280 [Spiroplasma chinense]|uniref:DUF3137 domain-containing protein n=1 Tax=Spiroplasma chinense TaxID=216932 RepID=A0A5B9Y4Z8_9MOLU|nr:hypothetical protein [Spiroplasma chinense]QEH62121.1 hypothetical protein SCHIN_v1c09280 [Spiroplasma chinense]